MMVLFIKYGPEMIAPPLVKYSGGTRQQNEESQ